MFYRYSRCDVVQTVPTQLASGIGLTVLGGVIYHGGNLVIARIRNSIIGVNISNGFYVPFGERWKLINEKTSRSSISGNDLCELVEAAFVLGREQAEKRLREQVGNAKECKFTFVFNGGIKTKDGTSEIFDIFFDPRKWDRFDLTKPTTSSFGLKSFTEHAYVKLALAEEESTFSGELFTLKCDDTNGDPVVSLREMRNERGIDISR